MGMAISQGLASMELCFHALSIVRMALRRLTEKHSSSDEFYREIVILILPHGYLFPSSPTDPKQSLYIVHEFFERPLIKIDLFYQKIPCSYKIGYLCQK